MAAQWDGRHGGVNFGRRICVSRGRYGHFNDYASIISPESVVVPLIGSKVHTPEVSDCR
jgi:hypothetical protein